MDPDRRRENIFRRMVEIFTIGPGIIALFVLITWILKKPIWGTLGQSSIPMAPGTAAMMLGLSSIIFLFRKRPENLALKRFAFIALGSIGIICLAVLGLFFLNFNQALREWQAFSLSPLEMGGTYPGGFISPLTALFFLTVSLAFWFQLPPWAKYRRYRQISAILVLTVFTICILILLNEGLGAPLAFEGQTVPIAIITAISFALLSLSLMAKLGTDIWPVSWVWAVYQNLHQFSSLPFFKNPLAIFVFLLAAIGVAGFFYLKYQVSQVRRAAWQELTAVADLKVNQIRGWYQERLSDAQYFFEAPEVARMVQSFLANPRSSKRRAEILSLLTTAQRNFHYPRILFFSKDQQLRLAVSEDKDWVSSRMKAFVNQTLRSGKIEIADLNYTQTGSRQIVLWIFVPISVQGEDFIPQEKPLGVLLFEIDPNQFLFPFIKAWPSPSSTAETLLIRREGEEAVFLSESRHRKKTALEFRLPFRSNPKSPEILAVQGRVGPVEGKDYRAIPVLAVLREVPGTPWSIVAKIDRDEVYTPLRKQTIITSLAVLITLLAAALGLSLQWRQHDNLLLRKQLAVEKERQVLTERFLSLNKQVNDIFLLMDQGWWILEANDRAIEAYGYTLDELQNMREPDLIPLDAQAVVLRRTGSGELWYGSITETIHQRKDGTRFPVETSVRAVEIGGKKYYQSIVRDITERKKAENSLRESEERFRHLFESMGNAVVVYEAVEEGEEFRIRDFNRAAEGIEKIKKEDLLGRKVTEVFPGIRDFGLFRVIQKVWASGNPEFLPASYYQDNRIAGWRENYVYKLPSGEVVAIYDDVTERKQAEEALQTSEAFLNSIVDQSPSPMWIADRQGTLIRLNQACRELLNVTDEEVIGRYNIFKDPILETHGLIPQVKRVFEEGEIARFEIRYESSRLRNILLRKYPFVYLDITIFAVRNAEGQITNVVVQHWNITERKQAEEEIFRLNAELEKRVIERTAQLEEANKELESFSYSVSHDLRAPLRSINGFSQALIEDYGSRIDERGRTYLDRMRSATGRMGLLIDDLLKLSRVSQAEIKPKKVDLSRLAEVTAKELQETEPSRRIEWIIPPEIFTRGDERLLEVVLKNLMGNAWKFTSRHETGRIEFGVQEKEGFRIFFIRDDGAGFDMEYTGKLFDPFQRLHSQEEFEGTGIGLAIVQRIIRRHHGRIWAEGAPEQGAIFYFTLEEK